MRGPSEAAKLVHIYISISAAPEKVSSLLKRIIEDQKKAINDDAIELSERWLKSFKHHLKTRIFQEIEQGYIPCCEFCSTSEEYIQGPCFIPPNSTEEEIKEKKLRANKHHYINAFSKISDNDFEALCSRILSLWKVRDHFVTRRSADQGIDFYGQVPFGELMKPSAIGHGAEKQLKIWLVGQAKNYKNSQVSTKDIRELVGSVNLARSKVYAGSKDPLSNLQMRTCDPVFFLFFTTGTISRDAWDLLSKSGVVAMDGIQLSVFLADHGVGIKDNLFDDQIFQSWAFGQ